MPLLLIDASWTESESMDLPLGIDCTDAVGAWVKVSGGGRMVGTDIASMATSPVEEV